jgi:hypothetical protein
MDLSSSGYWVNVLPKSVDLSALKYSYDKFSKLTLTDGNSFTMDINEFGTGR